MARKNESNAKPRRVTKKEQELMEALAAMQASQLQKEQAEKDFSPGAYATKGLNAIQPMNEEQEDFVYAMHNRMVTICDAKFGTGKTFLALVEGLKLVMAKEFSQILYVRPYLQSICTDQNLGALPGEANEKLSAMYLPITDNLGGVLSPTMMKNVISSKKIEVTIPSFIRGRSLKKTFVILDEAQNACKDTFKLVMSRLDKSSRLVITGSTDQIDLKRKEISFLQKMHEQLFGHEQVACVTLTQCVRNPVIGEIMELIEGIE